MSEPKLDPEYVSELAERLRSIATDDQVKHRYTHLKGEIKSFSRIITIAAAILTAAVPLPPEPSQ